MNDLDLIDRLGPSADDPSDAALAAARTRLAAAIASQETTPVRRTRRLPLLAAASVAVAAGAGAVVVPALVGSDDSVALATVDPLTFPVTASWMPSGLGDPVFSWDSGRAWIRYGEGEDRMGIATAIEPGEGCRDDDAVRLDIDGRPGWGFDGCADRAPGDPVDTPQYVIEWEQEDGDLRSVAGHGRYADPTLVERVAESIEDRSQSVDLFLTIAPRGWSLLGYQSDHHVTWSDPDWDGADEERDLTVSLVDRVSEDLRSYGIRDAHAVTVDGRHALLGRQGARETDPALWILQTTAPDGTAFSLVAPGRFTEEQVLEVAAGVRHH